METWFRGERKRTIFNPRRSRAKDLPQLARTFRSRGGVPNLSKARENIYGRLRALRIGRIGAPSPLVHSAKEIGRRLKIVSQRAKIEIEKSAVADKEEDKSNPERCRRIDWERRKLPCRLRNRNHLKLLINANLSFDVFSVFNKKIIFNLIEEDSLRDREKKADNGRTLILIY